LAVASIRVGLVCEAAAGFSALLSPTNRFWGLECQSVDEKSEKFQLVRYCSDQSGFPMRASDSSMGGDADQVSKIEGERPALIGAEGRLRP
jgi:hypothetical protein